MSTPPESPDRPEPIGSTALSFSDAPSTAPASQPPRAQARRHRPATGPSPFQSAPAAAESPGEAPARPDASAAPATASVSVRIATATLERQLGPEEAVSIVIHAAEVVARGTHAVDRVAMTAIRGISSMLDESSRHPHPDTETEQLLAAAQAALGNVLRGDDHAARMLAGVAQELQRRDSEVQPPEQAMRAPLVAAAGTEGRAPASASPTTAKSRAGGASRRREPVVPPRDPKVLTRLRRLFEKPPSAARTAEAERLSSLFTGQSRDLGLSEPEREAWLDVGGNVKMLANSGRCGNPLTSLAVLESSAQAASRSSVSKGSGVER